MELTRVYLDLPADVRGSLAGVDLRDELQKAGIEVTIEYGHIPGSADDEVKRDVALIIVAVGVTATLIGTAISKIIDARSRRPQQKTFFTEKPILDQSGNVVRDKDGKMVVERSEAREVQEMHGVPQENSVTEFKFGTILSFKTVSGEGLKSPDEKWPEEGQTPPAGPIKAVDQ